MTTPGTLEDPHAPPSGTGLDADAIADRMHRLEGEVAELRHTLSELAEIVVGDIRERREAAESVSAPLPEVAIPPSLVPGGETTLKAVNAARRPWLLFDLLRPVRTISCSFYSFDISGRRQSRGRTVTRWLRSNWRAR